MKTRAASGEAARFFMLAIKGGGEHPAEAEGRAGPAGGRNFHFAGDKKDLGLVAGARV